MLLDLLDEIKQYLIDLIKWIIKKGRYILLALIILIGIILIFYLPRREPEKVESQELYVFGVSISNLASGITIITIPITAIWALYQYKKSVKNRQQERASNIAKEFAENLVEKLSIIEKAYINSDFSKFMLAKEESVNKIKYFNRDEIRNIFQKDSYPDDYIKYRKANKKQLDDIYHLVLYCKNSEYDNSPNKFDDIKKRILENKITSKDRKCLKEGIKKSKDLPYHFLELESNVLNKLEYICMEIYSKSADSDYIYQSLHQMFLKGIRTLYLEISITNKDYVDKLYINIIRVYNLWQKKYLKEKKREEKRKRKSNDRFN